MITEEMHAEIKDVVNKMSETPSVKRMDGEQFKVYRVGRIIRVDITNGNEERE